MDNEETKDKTPTLQELKDGALSSIQAALDQLNSIRDEDLENNILDDETSESLESAIGSLELAQSDVNELTIPEG
jgi:Mg2+/Co2+ transporter CorC